MGNPIEDMKGKLALIFEKNRLETFTSWPYGPDKPCNSINLAEAGFYFTGNASEPDSVQCFLCDKPLDGWDEDDEPWAEHLRHSANCTFAQLGQPEQALTFEQYKELNLQLINKHLGKTVDQIRSNGEKSFKEKVNRLKTTITKPRRK